ncbi:hypothetical protein BJV78DRAFT_352457 [Lactifluus subvellereus]|nr:hypothetical protein BJV78DRAFT_352457 [Lactifluus subvellereus]
MCFYTRTRVSIRHVHRFYQIVILRAPRSSSLHSIVLLPPLVCQSRSLFLCAFVIGISGRPPVFLSFLTQSLLGDLGAIASLARYRPQAQPARDDRGCVSRAPMGGSTVPITVLRQRLRFSRARITGHCRSYTHGIQTTQRGALLGFCAASERFLGPNPTSYTNCVNVVHFLLCTSRLWVGFSYCLLC